jgi:AraC-like DNA-binding protein
MTINSQLLLILSDFGAFNGLLLSLYFFTLKPIKLSNQFLAALLLMISIRILKSVLFYFNPEITKTILQIGLSACFFIGPFLYFYCASKVGKIEEQPLGWPAHLAILFIIIFSIGLAYPYHSHAELWSNVFYKAINYLWLFYIVLAGITLKPLFKICFEKKLAFQDDDVWVLSIYTGNVIIWLAYFTASYTSYIVGALSFSFVFYLICLLAIFRFRASREKQSVRYANKKIEPLQANALINNLEQLMVEKKLYQDANLTLPNVAKCLSVPIPVLSQLLNDNLDKSFSLFINEYRIEAAKILLSNDKLIKMEVIAEQCGFNSQSTFYSAFKKITRATPAKFRQKNTQPISPEL